MYAVLVLRLYTKGRCLWMSVVAQPLKKLFSTPWSAPEESGNTPGGHDPLLVWGGTGVQRVVGQALRHLRAVGGPSAPHWRFKVEKETETPFPT